MIERIITNHSDILEMQSQIERKKQENEDLINQLKENEKEYILKLLCQIN